MGRVTVQSRDTDAVPAPAAVIYATDDGQRVAVGATPAPGASGEPGRAFCKRLPYTYKSSCTHTQACMFKANQNKCVSDFYQSRGKS